MQISIVVPVHNSGLFLEETIRSVIEQTHDDWELLLVDDGSTDNSADICRSFEKEDSRIKLLTKDNGGQASARNHGIMNAKYDWIAFLDSDDIYAPNRLSRQVEIVKTVEADFYYGAGYKFKSGDDHLLNKELIEWKYGEFTGKQFFKILYHSCAVNINTVLVKKSRILEIGLFNEEDIQRGTEDRELWLRIACKSKRVYGDSEPTVYYRQHDNNISKQKANILIGKIHFYNIHDNSPFITKKMRLKEFRYNYRELFNALSSENRLDEISQHFERFKQIDRFGFGTNAQRFVFRLFQPSKFLWISNKIIYRIAFRLESLSYKFMQ